MTSKAETMPGSRDLRFDSLRGLMLVLMTVNHLPTELRMVTDGYVGLFSSAEGFVFISGILAGYIYIRRLWKSGEVGLKQAAITRTKTIYAWHIASFLGCLIVVQATEKILGFCSQNSPQLFYSNPFLALGLGLSLLHQPGLLDLLPMYCVFVMLLPYVLPALEAGRAKWVLAASVGLWAVAQACPPIDGAPIYPIHMGTFNLFSWQLLFVVGMVIGHAKAKSTANLVPVRPWLIAGALGVVIYSFGIRHYQWQTPWADTFFGISLNKPNLGLLRLADFGCVAYLIAVIGGQAPALLTWRPLAFLGQASIAVVAAQSVLVMFLLEFPALFESVWSRTAVAVSAIAFLFASAALYHRHQRLTKAGTVVSIDSRQPSTPALDRAA